MAGRTLKPKSMVKKRRTGIARAKSKTRGLLEAAALGIDVGQVLPGYPMAGTGAVALSGPRPLPRSEQPVEDHPVSRMNQPLLSARTSFWLGVAFGMLIVGVLAFLAWELFQVELIQAGVVG